MYVCVYIYIYSYSRVLNRVLCDDTDLHSFVQFFFSITRYLYVSPDTRILCHYYFRIQLEYIMYLLERIRLIGRIGIRFHVEIAIIIFNGVVLARENNVYV